MKYCANCGNKLLEDAKFCPNCGEKVNTKAWEPSGSKTLVENETPASSDTNDKIIKQINRDITTQNNQTPIVKKMWWIAGFFFLIVFLAFSEIVEVHPAIAVLSGFFFVFSLIIGFMFRSREKKLQKLISGEKLLASWTLSPTQKEKYVNYLVDQEKGKNMVILMSISGIALIVFGIFIIVIDEGKLFMFLVLIGLIAFLSLFAFGAPLYYKRTNLKGDGKILIGKKYAYINGYFHNWDFPLSGISKVKIIKKPFHGIKFVYHYTDRTFQHSQELVVPASDEVDLVRLVEMMQ